MEFITRSSEQTTQLGEKIGELLHGGEVIAFTGDLGAGKTTMTRGISLGMGLGDEVTSPTFALLNIYQGDTLRLCHFDMYRIADSSQLESVSFYDCMDENTVIVIEWSENIADELDDDTIYIDIKRIDDDTREININGGDFF